MAKIAGIIPARMASSRFPGKPLASIVGLAMIEHVYRRTAMCQTLDEVYVATCDDEIAAVVEGFGGRMLMTSFEHVRASDRVAEAAREVGADIVVMVQGDEPMTTPDMITAAVQPLLEDPSVECVNLVQRIKSLDEFIDPNVIKVVMNVESDAIYFSRSPIPAVDFAAAGTAPLFKQVCVIPFRAGFLQEFSKMKPTPLEITESIDMLRIIEHGRRVRLVESDTNTHAVDTPADLMLVESLMKNDLLILQYCRNIESRGETA